MYDKPDLYNHPRKEGKRMFAKIKIEGLPETEKAAQEILEHIDAIKKAEMRMGASRVCVEVELKKDTASGN